MPESVCLSMILGNALGRSLSPSSNSSLCICFTDPWGSRRKPSADKRNFVVVRPPPAGLVLRSPSAVSEARFLRWVQLWQGALVRFRYSDLKEDGGVRGGRGPMGFESTFGCNRLN